MNNSAASNTFTMLYNHQLSLVTKYFHHFKIKRHSIKQCLPFSPPSSAPGAPARVLAPWVYLFRMFCSSGIMYGVTFCGCLLSCHLLWRSIHVVACTSNSFLFVEWIMNNVHCVCTQPFLLTRPFCSCTFGVFPPSGYCEQGCHKHTCMCPRLSP